MKINKKYIAITLVVATAIGAAVGLNYKWLAVQLAPKKHAATSRSDTALKADELFWRTLHGGEYERIPEALAASTAAYLATPNDAVTAAHIGWLHIWRLAERGRLERVPPTITDDAVLARKYFEEAVSLDPTDARYLGFLASSLLSEGTIHHDEALVRRGYFTLLDSIKAWPQFNLFTAGYVMSGQPADSKQFREALDRLWQALDECVGEKVNRRNLDYSKYMKLATTRGPKRVCWNSWIAPHNFEGFFLSLGDTLVKAGHWQEAQKAYANAKLSPEYAKWKFRDVLQQRIEEAHDNVALFNAPDDSDKEPKVRMMAKSEFNCMACHQQ